MTRYLAALVLAAVFGLSAPACAGRPFCTDSSLGFTVCLDSNDALVTLNDGWKLVWDCAGAEAAAEVWNKPAYPIGICPGHHQAIFVSLGGSDGNDGGSPDCPVRTIARAAEARQAIELKRREAAARRI